MKHVKLIIALIAISAFTTKVEAQSFKEKMAAKMSKSKGGKKGDKGAKAGKFASFNQESDELGINGEYHGLVDKRSFGFKYVKEADGKIVNELHYYEKPGTVALKLSLKESYYRKNQVKMFYKWMNPSAKAYVEVVEIDKGVLAQVSQTKFSQNDNNPASLETDRKVIDVMVKDREQHSVYDLETAQAKLDMIIMSLNTEKLEKEKAQWMKFDVYKNNVDKVVFSNKWQNLQKRGYPNKIGVDGKGFKTELDMSGDMVFMAFFSYPPSVKYAGQQINIHYEMDGVKSNREECRKRSAAWSKMVKILETKDFNYNQSSVRSVREYNTYHSQYVQDYAAIEVLYKNKDKFKVDGVYTLNVKFYAHRDGEDGDLLAEGTVKLKYTAAAKKAFEGDPAKPELKGVWGHYDSFLDE